MASSNNPFSIIMPQANPELPALGNSTDLHFHPPARLCLHVPRFSPRLYRGNSPSLRNSLPRETGRFTKSSMTVIACAP